MTVLSILMPVFNEHTTVAEAIERVLEAGIPVPFEIISVDDGSSDGSAQVLGQLSRAIDQLRVIRHDRNLGKGYAIRSALEHARGEFACVHDADLECDAHDLVRMYKVMQDEQPDAVYGTREFSTRDLEARTYAFGNKFVSRVASALYATRVHDIMTCHKMMSVALFRDLDLQSASFEIEAEITAKLLVAGRQIVDLPIAYRPRGHSGGKKLRKRDALRVLRVLARTKYGSRTRKTAALVGGRNH